MSERLKPGENRRLWLAPIVRPRNGEDNAHLGE